MDTGPDPYRQLASEVLGKPEVDVTKEERTLAKHAIFKAIYTVSGLPGNERLREAISESKDADGEEHDPEMLDPVSKIRYSERKIREDHRVLAADFLFWGRVADHLNWAAGIPEAYPTSIHALNRHFNRAQDIAVGYIRMSEKLREKEAEKSTPRYRADSLGQRSGMREIYRISNNGETKTCVLVIPNDVVIDVVEELNRAVAGEG